MTWLELIEELRKQPMHLLEQDVLVWNYVYSNGSRVTNLVGAPGQLLTQDKDDADPDDWGPDGCCTMSLECFYDVPDEFFTKRRDFDATIHQHEGRPEEPKVYEPKHMKPQVKALLIEALGPGSPQLTVDEFTSADEARQEMRDRWNDANERNDCLIADSFIDGDFATLLAENERYEWQVYEIGR